MTRTKQASAATQAPDTDTASLTDLMSFAHATRTPKISARAAGTGTRDQTQLFEGGEHTYIGDSVWLQFSANITIQAGSILLRLENGLALTYGNILALGGDFYGIPDRPISDGETAQARVERFAAGYAQLAIAPASKEQAPQILDVMNIEIDAVNLACRLGKQPSDAYDELGDSLSWKWNSITGGIGLIPGRYLKLAATNWDHFGEHAVAAYSAGHQLAMQTALDARAMQDPEAQKLALETAYAMNAFADHFLTDLFSSGHMRTPRKALYDCSILRREPTGLAARYMHDEDCTWGLYVANAAGNTWLAYGDKRYSNNNDTQNMAYVNEAAQASADEIYAVFSTGVVPAQDAYAALALAPNLDALQDRDDRTNFTAFFVVDPDGTVLERNDYRYLNGYTWNDNWLVLKTLAKQKNVAHHTLPPDGFIPAPHVRPRVEGWSTQQQDAPVWVAGNRIRYAVSFYNERNGAINETPWGPWSDLELLNNDFKPEITVPVDPMQEATGRRIYRQCNGAVATLVGDIDGNTTAVFIDTNNDL